MLPTLLRRRSWHMTDTNKTFCRFINTVAVQDDYLLFSVCAVMEQLMLEPLTGVHVYVFDDTIYSKCHFTEVRTLQISTCITLLK